MALQDTLDKKLKIYWTYSGSVTDAVPDIISGLLGRNPIYISCTGGTVLVESRNGADAAYASEGSVDNATSVLESPHIEALRLTPSGGDAFITISIKREHHGKL